ncbi:MAG: alpha/beta hydrolase [Acidimicrobiia bacterium]|nr:alpha/beta hydrolase [Acidimicrobiia bacterium]
MSDLSIDVADGTRLEAELALDEDATALAVLAHPHPLYGGSMHAGLVDELFRLLPRAGVGALRFNFRGVGASTGTHDEGRGERADLAAAVDAAVAVAGDRPLLTCGWSFGADMSLALDDPRPVGFVLVAPPLRIVAAEQRTIGGDPRPKLLLVPEHDQFRPPAAAIEETEGWTATTIVPVAGADHFLWGHAEEVAGKVVAFAATFAAGGAAAHH